MLIKGNLRKSLYIIFFSCFFNLTSTDYSFIKAKQDFGLLKGFKISFVLDNNEMGFLSYLKLPLVRWYILYDFYIEPKIRSQGYGKHLLEMTLGEVLNTGASKIFIQPGPFELVNNKFVALKANEHTMRMQRLIKLYGLYNFELVNSKYLSKILALVYSCFGIDEDPHFLMMRTIY